jgi:hypothetical protein
MMFAYHTAASAQIRYGTPAAHAWYISALHMRAMRSVLSVLFCLGAACGSPGDGAAIPPHTGTTFRDGFENANALQDLFAADASRFSATQIVDAGVGTNSLFLATEHAHSGLASLGVDAYPSSDAVISKSDIQKQGFHFYEGDVVTITAWFYAEDAADLSDVFVLDLECEACWDPNVPNNQTPGIRVQLKGIEGYAVVERDKIGLTGESFRQDTYALPRNRWVPISWRLVLSPNTDGLTELRVDDTLVISRTGINMPSANIFAETFAAAGLTFELQQPVFYERLQVGVTAAGASHVHLFVDDVHVEQEVP